MYFPGKLKIVFILYILTAFSIEENAAAAGVANVTSKRKHIRIFSGVNGNYSVAKAKCEDAESRLVEITTQAINEAIKSALREEKKGSKTIVYWTGGTDQIAEGTWKWNNNTNFSYETRKEGRNSPSEIHNDDQDCLVLYIKMNENEKDLIWADTVCEELQLGYICEQVKVTISKFQNVDLASDGASTTQTCVADGFPSTTGVWKRNRAKVPEQSSESVYQTTQVGKTILHFANATISDEGNYSCRAENVIWGARKSSSKDFYLSVPGAPTNVTVGADPCQLKITVDWKPNARALNHKHRITAELDGREVSSHEETPKTTGSIRTVLQQNLTYSTVYSITVSACTAKECKHGDEVMQTVTTGGKPNAVKDLILGRANAAGYCNVSWSPPPASGSRIQYKIIVKSRLVKVTARTAQPVDELAVNISVGTTTYSVSTKPNRNYTVEVSAMTCRGYGPVTNANQNCESDVEAPDSIPAITEPVISNEDVKIILPTVDESNGPISCLFIVMKKGCLNTNESSSSFELDELRHANKSLGNDSKLFIAFAEPPDRMGASLTFGKNTSNSCNILSVQSGRKKRAVGTHSYTGHSMPLQEGADYSIFLVTTTPAAQGRVLFQKGNVTVFVNRFEGSPRRWLVPVIIVLILIAVIFLLIWKRDTIRRKFRANPEETNQPPMIPETVMYENIRINAEQTQQRSSTDIAMKDFQEVYNSMLSNDNEEFRKEFEELATKERLHTRPANVGSAPALKKKNRYKNILPYDITRVVLQSTSSGYINACYINGFEQEYKFIACQGPLLATVDDFWQMVFEQRCKIVVMLTKCEEKGKKKCEQYWPNAGQTFDLGVLSVTNQQEEKYGGYSKRTITVETKVGTNAPLTVLQYQFLAWPDHGTPATTSNLMRMHNAVMEQHMNNGKKSPIIVHCSAGAGRTGTFIGYDILLNERKAYNRADIFNCVLTMRMQRMQMVQTVDQYIFVHTLVLEAYMFGNRDLVSGEVEDVLKQSQQGGLVQLASEFNELSQMIPMKNKKVLGSKAANQIKNRSQDFIPYDYCIVELDFKSGESTSPYFNGSWIETYDEAVRMIATQGPLASNESLEEFWRAVMDNSVTVIIMLTDLFENTVEQSAQYWPAHVNSELVTGDITVKLMEENKENSTVHRVLQVQRKKNTRIVRHHQYLDWKENSCPENATDILNLVKALMDSVRDSKQEPALVHCSDGAGRTGAFCAIVNLIERVKAENQVDVFRAVKDLRICRPGMVQTLDQYYFCYQAVVDYLRSFDLYSNFRQN